MMQALIQWVASERRRNVRRAASGPAVFRRLAIEAVEDRLLLSATAGVTASEGGTVFLGSLAPGLAPGSTRLVELDGRLVIVFNSNGCLVVSGEFSACEPAGGGLAGEIEARAAASPDKSEARFGPARPELVQFALGEFGSGPAEGGMVDVARIASEKVYADASRLAATPGERAAPRRPAAGGIAADGLQEGAAGQLAPSRLEAAVSKGIHGSLGSLEAFDLALRQETGLERPASSGESDSRLERNTDALPVDDATTPEWIAAVSLADQAHRWNSVDHFPRVEDAPRQENGPAHQLPTAQAVAIVDAPPRTRGSLAAAHPVAVSKESAGQGERVIEPQRRPAELASLVVLAGIGYELVSDQRRRESLRECLRSWSLTPPRRW